MNTMFECRDVGKLLYDYIEGSLDLGLSRKLEQHLADCPACLAFINTYRQTIKLSKELRPKNIPPELHQKLRSFIKSNSAFQRPPLWKRLWLRLAGSP